MTNYKTMLRIVDDLKYLDRLTKVEFWELLFTHSVKPYVDAKWDLFKNDKLGFMTHVLWTRLKYLLITSIIVKRNENGLRIVRWLI